MSDDTKEVNVAEEIKVELPDSESETEETTETPEVTTEKETPSESSTEEETTTPAATDELKPVPGETPKERALRLETTRLRAKLREKRAGELFAGEEQTPPASPEKKSNERLEKLREKYNADDLSSLQEVFLATAEDMGFVRKDQIQQTTFQQVGTDILDTFVENHPEYAPENDPDDVLWNQFKAEVNLYRQPSNPKEYRRIFERVHKTIFGPTASEKLTEVEAKQATIKAASHATAPRTQQKQSSNAPKPSVDPAIARQWMHGFTPEELKEMGL